MAHGGAQRHHAEWNARDRALHAARWALLPVGTLALLLCFPSAQPFTACPGMQGEAAAGGVVGATSWMPVQACPADPFHCPCHRSRTMAGTKGACPASLGQCRCVWFLSVFQVTDIASSFPSNKFAACRGMGCRGAWVEANSAAGAAVGGEACQEGFGEQAGLPWTLQCSRGGGRAPPQLYNASWRMYWCQKTWPAARSGLEGYFCWLPPNKSVHAEQLNVLLQGFAHYQRAVSAPEGEEERASSSSKALWAEDRVKQCHMMTALPSVDNHAGTCDYDALDAFELCLSEYQGIPVDIVSLQASKHGTFLAPRTWEL